MAKSSSPITSSRSVPLTTSNHTGYPAVRAQPHNKPAGIAAGSSATAAVNRSAAGVILSTYAVGDEFFFYVRAGLCISSSSSHARTWEKKIVQGSKSHSLCLHRFAE
jgi:hypothetical protein